MLSPGKGEHDHSMKTAFPGAELFNAPDIRTWGILDSRFEQSIGVDQSALKKVKSLSSKYKALWCPTFRDEQIPDAYQEISLVTLNEFCKRMDIHFFIKPHRHDERLSALEADYANLHFVAGSSDVYPLVKHFQTTITDYSSVAVDFIENDIPTLLFQFDLEKYTSFRKIRTLPNAEGLPTAYSQTELERLLSENMQFSLKQNVTRDFEEEKENWIEFIETLLNFPN
jgi:CDP-glycerol glycerophosphotransferase (TagB/SpsB family)